MKFKICKIFSFVGFGIIVLIATMLVFSEKADALFGIRDFDTVYDETQEKIQDTFYSFSEKFGDLIITSSITAYFGIDEDPIIENIEIENTNTRNDIVISKTTLEDCTGGMLFDFGSWKVSSSEFGILFDGQCGETYSSNISIPAGKKICFTVETTLAFSSALKLRNQVPISLSYKVCEISAYVTLNKNTLSFYCDENYEVREGNKWLVPEYYPYYSPDTQTMPGWAKYNPEVIEVYIDKSFLDYKPTNCTGWFMGVNTNQIDCSYINMENVITTTYMFSNLWVSGGKSEVTGSISSINFGNKFSTANCICMTNMFNSYFGEKIQLPDEFSTKNVQKFDNFLKLHESCINRATLVDVLFPHCFTFESALSTRYFFLNQAKLQRISGWNCCTTKNVSFTQMFKNCKNLQIITVPDFQSEITWTGPSADVFENCINLVGFNGYHWGSSDVSSLAHAHLDKTGSDSLFTYEKYGGILVNDQKAKSEHNSYFENIKYRICPADNESLCVSLGSWDGEKFTYDITEYKHLPEQEVYLRKDINNYLYVESSFNRQYRLSLPDTYSSMGLANFVWSNDNKYQEHYSNKWIFESKEDKVNNVEIYSGLTTQYHVACVNDWKSLLMMDESNMTLWKILPCDLLTEKDSDIVNKETPVNKTTSMQENLDSFNVCELQKDSTLDMALSGLIVVGVGCLGGRRVIRHRLKIKEFWLCLNSKYK